MNISEQIDQHYEQASEPPRPHMGCSLLGHVCDRYLWLSFRWAVTEQFSGRMLRLFKRGHSEEATAIRNLRSIGINVFKTQDHVDFGQHVSGSIDGILDNVPDHPHIKYLFECKTFNRKSFNELEKKGVKDAKPMHYIQMQVYMLGAKLQKALYYAVCKDDDRLWIECIDYDPMVADSAVKRGQAIAMSQRMPEPISATQEYYVCRMCSMREFCHQTQCTKNVNCRTCVHAEPKPDSTWQCNLFPDSAIPYNHQLTGCDHHVLHPDLIPYIHNINDDGVTAKLHTSKGTVNNGAHSASVYTSSEILADIDLCVANDPLVMELRDKMQARIVANEK